jgi:predicted dehydrogenase
MVWTHSSWFYYRWGLLEDTGYHTIDAVNFLCNSKFEDVKVVARDYINDMGCLNHIMLMMLFRNNASALVDLSWVSGCVEASLKVQGTAGMLNVDLRNDHIQETHGYLTPLEDLKSHIKKSFKTMRAALDKTYFKGTLLYHRQIVEDFISSITDGGEPPIPGEEGREIVAIMDAIKQSLSNHIEAKSDTSSTQTEKK